MKAFLLAAGLGTRLKPITDSTPKCLVDIAGKPLLDYWIRLFIKNNISEVLINTHHLSNQVHEYICNINAKEKNINLIEFYENELLGSGGTIAANFDFVKDDEMFFICNADNLTDINLLDMAQDICCDNEVVLSMALFFAKNPSECGIVNINKDKRIIDFEEKPNNPQSNLANAGIYLARREIFEYIPKNKFVDIGKDILPKLTNKMRGWESNFHLLDIGTPKKLCEAQQFVNVLKY